VGGASSSDCCAASADDAADEEASGVPAEPSAFDPHPAVITTPNARANTLAGIPI
jgi:hypothetical protein